MNSKPFPGFPTKTHFTPLPNLFFTTLLSQIGSLAELKLILYIFWLLYQKRNQPRFVTDEELLADKTLMEGIEGVSAPAEVLRSTLESALKHGVLLHLALDREGEPRDLYFINDEPSRRAIARLQSGELSLDGVRPVESPMATLPKAEPYIKEEKPNIFALYEQNIGLLTPMIAEELKEAEKLYPASWIEEAFKEAVSLNKRNWRYIARILERWSSEGKESGEFRRDSKKKVITFKERYGHLVKR
ncbi:MAG TPA: DnaD domain protein [Dehalococcoidia bacterium]|nr:DnaD domain protein [Dehalococcoidia bacterium]